MKDLGLFLVTMGGALIGGVFYNLCFAHLGFGEKNPIFDSKQNIFLIMTVATVLVIVGSVLSFF